MRHLRALLCAAVLLVGTFSRIQLPRSTGPSDTPTIQVTSRLVFLDVTVLDKKGRPVVNGLEQRRLHHHRRQETAIYLFL